MKKYFLVLLFLLLLPLIYSFTPSLRIPYQRICCADLINNYEGNDSLKTNSTCCQYAKNPNECYTCFEQKREEYKSEKIRSIALLVAYIVALFTIGILLFINKIKKDKILNDRTRKILFWILMVLIFIPLLFLLIISVYSGIPIF